MDEKLKELFADVDTTFDADEIVESGQALFDEVCRLSDKLIALNQGIDSKTIDVMTRWNRLLVRIDAKLLTEINKIGISKSAPLTCSQNHV